MRLFSHFGADMTSNLISRILLTVLVMRRVVTESLPNAMFRVTLDANEVVRLHDILPHPGARQRSALHQLLPCAT